MGHQLNKLTDTDVVDHLAFESGLLRDLLAKPVPSSLPDRLRYHHALADTFSEVGLMRYQQEAPPSEVRTPLAQAAEHFFLEHQGRPEPEAHSYRHAWNFEKTINLVVCFGSRDTRPRLAEIGETQYRYPQEPDTDVITTYLEALKRYVAHGVFDPETLRDVEQACLQDNAPKEYRKYVLPATQGLLALHNADESSWNTALSDLLHAHEEEARWGHYKRSVEGFIALPALMLAQLGIERGLTCAIDSPYLPLFLLTHTP